MTKLSSTRTARFLALGLALALFAACGSSSGGDAKADSTTTMAAGAGKTGDAVSIKGFAFNPKTLDVKVGTKVTWTNDDGTKHTASADDKSFNTKSIEPGKTGTFTFTKAGTFSYHCEIHPTMSGEIVVS